MELGKYFKVLSRHKFTLVIVPLLTIIITFFLVRNQADTYTSETQIATGIVDKSQQMLASSSEQAQESQISQDFDNLVQMLRTKKIVDQVSYQLMIHDLTSNEPFRKPSKLFLQLNQSAREHALTVYTDFYNNHKALSLYNADQNGLHSLLVSMKYDNESLLKNLAIYRAENSDFINIDFSSDNSQLSAFVANTLAHEFITYYNSIVKENQNKAISFLGNLTNAKKDTLNAKINALKDYKIQNRILNITEQSRALYTQITNFETALQDAERNAIATAATIRSINNQFKPAERQYMESLLVPVNSEIVSLNDQLQQVNKEDVQNNFAPQYEAKKDSLIKKLNDRILQASDNYTVNPLATKQNLVQQRLTLQLQYDLAKNSIASYQEELVRLNKELDGVVPHEAVVQEDESAVDIASREYMDILNKYNQTSLDANYIGELRQLETAMPGIAEPSKKMLLVILSGIIAFIFCLLIFFLLYFFDDTIKTPGELANKTGVPVLGYLNLLSSNTIDLRKVWTDPNPDVETYQFRNLLQSIRFEVDSEMENHKVLLVNSLAGGEGKTFVATNLAYAYSLVNKRVLLIDGNFHHPSITNSVKSKLFVEDYLNSYNNDLLTQNTSKITVFSNKGGDGSLFEVTKEEIIAEKFERLREAFDVIIIEASSLDTLNKSKEWNKYSDKILAVFEAGKNIKHHQKPNVEYLSSLNGKFIGWVLNVVHKLDAEAEEHNTGA